MPSSTPQQRRLRRRRRHRPSGRGRDRRRRAGLALSPSQLRRAPNSQQRHRQGSRGSGGARHRRRRHARDITILADVAKVPYRRGHPLRQGERLSGAQVLWWTKGDAVKSGSAAAATIESQETDAQYASAAADLANKRQIARRYDQLAQQNAIAAQQKDQADADARIAQATLNQDATLKGYERLTAPFDGKVTRRGTPMPATLGAERADRPDRVAAGGDGGGRHQAAHRRLRAAAGRALRRMLGDKVDIVDAANSRP